MAPTANCPVCRAALTLTAHDSFDSWVCPAGHGLAATLSEMYEVAQEDEVHRLWQLVRAAPKGGPSAHPCPMCSQPMVTVAVPVDADEAAEGEAGDTPDTGTVTVEVCAMDEAIWFDAGELDEFPADLPDAQPTPEQEAALANIRKTFGDDLMTAMQSHPDLAERIATHLKRPHLFS